MLASSYSLVPSSSAPAVGFVPSASSVSLGGFPSSGVVWRRGLGAVVLSSASLEAGVLSVFLADGSSFRCLAAAFGGSFPSALLEAVRSAVSSGSPVFLCVAVGRSGRAAPGYFCGLSSSLPSSAPVAPAPGSVVGF